MGTSWAKLVLGVAVALGVGAAQGFDDAANGQKLYKGQLAGSYACSQCHVITNASDKIRSAAGNPDQITFAINTNPDSTQEMRPLYGVGGTFELSDGDKSDLAAYIDSVVNPNTGGSTPTFAAAPSSANFGSVAVGAQSATQTLTIGVGASAGTINNVSSSNNTEFLVVGGSCLAPLPHGLAASASCTLQVRFAPSLMGARSSTLTVTTNGTPNPLNVGLAGTGAESAPAQGNLTGPSTASFGAQALFVQSATKTLTFSNSGTAPVVITSVASNAAEFPVVATSCGGSLAIGQACTVGIAFLPTTAGSRSATLSIVNNGATPSVSVQLSGSGASGTTGNGSKIAVVEYYNATLNHYFITSNTGEIGLLGKPPFDAWQPTGLSFQGYAPAGHPASSVGVCRFYNDHFLGISTHFYAPQGLGCEATISQFPDWTLEDAQLFYASLPDFDGNCPGGQVPVYRLYNNNQGGAPNHRFTTSAAVRQQMLDRGYIPEGYGIGVGWCAPQ